MSERDDGATDGVDPGPDGRDDGTTDHVVAGADELAEGEHVVVEIAGREVGVFDLGGEYRAYANWCPHHGGPACAGSLDGTTEAAYDRAALEMDLEWVKEGRVLRCPWHAWEFDVASGACLHSDRYRLVDHDVRVEDGDVVVSL